VGRVRHRNDNADARRRAQCRRIAAACVAASVDLKDAWRRSGARCRGSRHAWRPVVACQRRYIHRGRATSALPNLEMRRGERARPSRVPLARQIRSQALRAPRSRRVPHRMLTGRHAWHSSAMEPALGAIRDAAATCAQPNHRARSTCKAWMACLDAFFSASIGLLSAIAGPMGPSLRFSTQQCPSARLLAAGCCRWVHRPNSREPRPGR